MRQYETTVPVLFSRFYLVSRPQPLEDDPRVVWGPEGELAVSAGDGIGLNSITSDHTAHVTLVIADDAAEVAERLRTREPRYWFTSSTGEIAVTDTEGRTALIAAAPAVGRIACAIDCTGRDETFNARHHEHRDQIQGVERWHITIWPDPIQCVDNECSPGWRRAAASREPSEGRTCQKLHP